MPTTPHCSKAHQSQSIQQQKQQKMFTLVLFLPVGYSDRAFFHVVSRQSSHHFACVASHHPRDTSPLCSPSFHLTLTYPGLPLRLYPHLSSPILTFAHLCSPVLPRLCPSPVALQSRASILSEKDSWEPEQALGGSDMPLVSG